MATHQKGSVLKLILELGPLVTFFAVNAKANDWGLDAFAPFQGLKPETVPIMAATAAFMLATVVALSVSMVAYRRIPVMPLVSGVIVIVFGGLTLYLQNDTFIKMKPTIVNLVFATTLLVGLYLFKRPLLAIVFDSVFQIDNEGWWKLTLRWGLFFLVLAALNEIVWRNFSTDTWVTFKVFGTMPLTILFTVSQLPLLQKHALEQEAEPESAA
ncbi:septation protein A [Acuticoccus sediminis]|uniref:Inner membrane-spanning protein YciB n=1 Tax=Acuticoccus sediminis TaxID=2184697 RepID=A0A8B2NGB3_9HYPH|nr:septation protein A [Acuticoccus sediminis]RAH98171.1 septation protein A [Acuticoccus sediminis]